MTTRLGFRWPCSVWLPCWYTCWYFCDINVWYTASISWNIPSYSFVSSPYLTVYRLHKMHEYNSVYGSTFDNLRMLPVKSPITKYCFYTTSDWLANVLADDIMVCFRDQDAFPLSRWCTWILFETIYFAMRIHNKCAELSMSIYYSLHMIRVWHERVNRSYSLIYAETINVSKFYIRVEKELHVSILHSNWEHNKHVQIILLMFCERLGSGA